VRLFVAVWPDEAALVQLGALNRPSIDGVRWTTREQWHVTLRFLGELEDPAPVERSLRQAVRGVGATVASFGAEVTRIGNMLWAPVEGLTEVAGAVVEATKPYGQPPEDRPFRGHITLARQRSRTRGRGLRPAQGQPLSESWKVEAIELVRSHLGREGARYETVARLALNG
jgi:2'-5' RNA ligase